MICLGESARISEPGTDAAIYNINLSAQGLDTVATPGVSRKKPLIPKPISLYHNVSHFKQAV